MGSKAPCGSRGAETPIPRTRLGKGRWNSGKGLSRGTRSPEAENETMAMIVRTWFLIALGMAVLVSAFAPSTMAAAPLTQPEPAAAVSITLYGNTTRGWGLAPASVMSPGPTLTVDQGDVITFTLFAQDSTPHTLVIDLDSDGIQDTGEPVSISFNSPTTGVTFQYTADTAGTIQYFCGLHGPNPMRGTLTVRSATTPPGDNTLLIVGGVVVVVVIVAAAAMMLRRKKPGSPPQP